MRFRKKSLRWERTGYHVVAAQQDTNIEFYVIWGGGSNAGGKGWGRVGRVEVWGWLVDLAGSPGSPSPPQWPLISQVVSPLCTQHTVTHRTADTAHHGGATLSTLRRIVSYMVGSCGEKGGRRVACPLEIIRRGAQKIREGQGQAMMGVQQQVL